MAMNRFVDFALSALALVGASAAAAPQPHLATAVLAGGCFWGMEAVFEHVKGVDTVVSGFAGGSAKDADYEDVSSERTGHAEAIRITYDPSKISYFDLLKIYFTVAHDPTEVNRQGPDVGASYRSAIFPQDAQQKAVAARTIAQLKARGKPIATRIESGGFYPAEAYHQDYVRKHPDAPYVVVNDLPKLAKLKREYPGWWKA
jgi:peptide-methionine (S)-S-oxide reductase